MVYLLIRFIIFVLGFTLLIGGFVTDDADLWKVCIVVIVVIVGLLGT